MTYCNYSFNLLKAPGLSTGLVLFVPNKETKRREYYFLFPLGNDEEPGHCLEMATCQTFSNHSLNDGSLVVSVPCFLILRPHIDYGYFMISLKKR